MNQLDDMTTDKIKKIVLAYSGGLDTSVMLRWLRDKYQCEVVCYCADVGQGAEMDGLEEKAKATGGSKLYIEDLREEFVRDPMRGKGQPPLPTGLPDHPVPGGVILASLLGGTTILPRTSMTSSS